MRSARIPSRDEVTDETLMPLGAVAALAFADGSITEQTLRVCCKQHLVQYYHLFGIMQTTIRDVQQMPIEPWMLHAEQGRDLIYVVGYSYYVKIGFTRGHIGKRLDNLNTASPLPVEIFGSLLGDRTLERELHKRFAQYRLQGEWFRRVGRLARWISEGCPGPNDGGAP